MTHYSKEEFCDLEVFVSVQDGIKWLACAMNSSIEHTALELIRMGVPTVTGYFLHEDNQAVELHYWDGCYSQILRAIGQITTRFGYSGAPVPNDLGWKKSDFLLFLKESLPGIDLSFDQVEIENEKIVHFCSNKNIALRSAFDHLLQEGKIMYRAIKELGGTQSHSPIGQEDHVSGAWVEAEVSSTLHEIFLYCQEVDPDMTKDRFIKEIYVPILNDASKSSVEEQRTYFFSRKPGEPFNIFSISHVAMAYCAHADLSLAANKSGEALQHVCDAIYWTGVILGSKGIEVVSENSMAAGRKMVAKSGGEATSKKLEPVRREAERLARLRAKDLFDLNGKKPSKRKVALDIKQTVLDFAKKQGDPLSENQAERTIIGWLSNLPDACHIFREKSSPSTS